MNDLELINPDISEHGIYKFIFLRPITLQQSQPDNPNIFELTHSMNMIEKEEQQCKNRKLAFTFKELKGSNNFKHKFVFKSLIKNIQEDDDEKAQVLATLIYKSGEEKIQHNICDKINNTELDILTEQSSKEPYYLWGISFPNNGILSLKRKKTNLLPIIGSDYIEFYDITKILINDKNFTNKHLLTIIPSDSDRIFTYKTIATSYTPIRSATKGIHAYIQIIDYITNIFGFDINNIFTTVFLKKLLLKNTDKNIKLIFKIEEEDEGLLSALFNNYMNLYYAINGVENILNGQVIDAIYDIYKLTVTQNPSIQSNRLTDEEITEFKKSGISETLINSINTKQYLLDTYINKLKEKKHYEMVSEGGKSKKSKKSKRKTIKRKTTKRKTTKRKSRKSKR